MRLKTTLLLFVMAISVYCHAQYNLVQEKLLTDHIPASENINDIKFAIRGDTLCQLRVLNNDNSEAFKITMYNIVTGVEISSDTLSGLPKFLVKQLDFNSNYIFIVGNDKYIAVNLKEGTVNIDIPQDFVLKPFKKIPPYRNCHFLNDSIVLMSVIYNYNPFSRDAGLYMSLFNIQTKKFIKEYFSEFPGVVLSHLNYNNITVSNDRIYVITPLNGEIWQYDFDLSLISKKASSIFSVTDVKKNIAFANESDSLVLFNKKHIDSLLATIEKDSIDKFYSANIIDKKYITKIIDSFSLGYSFVANVYCIAEDVIGVCVSRPEYIDNKVDFYIVNAKTGKTIKEYKKWVCSIPLQITKQEDLVTVNLNVGAGNMPYFKNGKVYVGTTLSKLYFEKGKTEDIMEKIFKNNKKSGYKWHLLEYTY